MNKKSAELKKIFKTLYQLSKPLIKFEKYWWFWGFDKGL